VVSYLIRWDFILLGLILTGFTVETLESFALERKNRFDSDNNFFLDCCDFDSHEALLLVNYVRG